MSMRTHREDRRRRRISAFAGWVFAAAMLLLPMLGLFSGGAIEVYLSFHGEIEGEVIDPDHKGSIEILGFNDWRATNSGTTHAGGGGGSGKVSFSDIGFTKWVDKSSPILMLYCAQGKHINKAKLSFVEKISDFNRPVFTMDFENIIVTGYRAGDEKGEPIVDVPDEFDLNFSEFSTTVFTYPDGGGEGTFQQVTWDIVTVSGSDGQGTANTSPVISDVPNQTINEDGSVLVNFTVDDQESVNGSLVVSRGTDNPLLLPLSSISLVNNGTNRSATLTPVADQHGSATVTLTVSDGIATDSTTFTFTVDPVNDPPSITPPGAQVTSENVTRDVSVTLDDIDTDINTVILTGTAQPAALISSITDVTASGSIRTVRIVPAPSATGTATITLTADDGALQTQEDFSLTINPVVGGLTEVLVNGSGPGSDIPFAENPAPGAVIGQLDALDGGGMNHTYVLLDGAGPFDIAGDELIVGNPGDFDFELNPTLSLTIQASDVDDPARTHADTFTVALINVNEAGFITAPASYPDSPPDTTVILSGVSLSDPDAGSNTVSFTVDAVSSVLNIDDSGVLAGQVGGNGTDSLSVAASISDINSVLAADGLTLWNLPGGTVPITFGMDDLGHAGTGSNQTSVSNSTINIILTDWEEWRRLHFSEAQLLDAQISGFEWDCDGDGLPNGVEYAVGTDPKDPTDGPGSVTLSEVEDGGIKYPGVSFTRRIGDGELDVAVQVATDLIGWSSGPPHTVEMSVVPMDAEHETVTVRSAASFESTPRQQMRLNVTLASP